MSDDAEKSVVWKSSVPGLTLVRYPADYAGLECSDGIRRPCAIGTLWSEWVSMAKAILECDVPEAAENIVINGIEAFLRYGEPFLWRGIELYRKLFPQSPMTLRVEDLKEDDWGTSGDTYLSIDCPDVSEQTLMSAFLLDWWADAFGNYHDMESWSVYVEINGEMTVDLLVPDLSLDEYEFIIAGEDGKYSDRNDQCSSPDAAAKVVNELRAKRGMDPIEPSMSLADILDDIGR